MKNSDLQQKIIEIITLRNFLLILHDTERSCVEVVITESVIRFQLVSRKNRMYLYVPRAHTHDLREVCILAGIAIRRMPKLSRTSTIRMPEVRDSKLLQKTDEHLSIVALINLYNIHNL